MEKTEKKRLKTAERSKRTNIRRISKAESSAMPEIKAALKAAGFEFSDSYTYRVIIGGYNLYNADILRIANPIVERHAKIVAEAEAERVKLEAQRAANTRL